MLSFIQFFLQILKMILNFLSIQQHIGYPCWLKVFGKVNKNTLYLVNHVTDENIE